MLALPQPLRKGAAQKKSWLPASADNCRRRKAGGNHGTATHLFLNTGLRFSTNAAIPSF
jgi:hypothetical protein